MGGAIINQFWIWIMASKETPAVDTEGMINTEIKNLEVRILTKSPHVNGNVIRGHGVLNAEKNTFEFFQTRSEQKKNPVLARTHHLCFRKQKDGTIRGTVTFDESNKYIREQVLAEFRECFTKITEKKWKAATTPLK